MKDLTIGEHLQNWCLREKIDVTSPLFPGAVDLAIQNALRDQDDRSLSTTSPVRSGATAVPSFASAAAN